MILIDSNILIDIFTEDDKWFDWSANKVAELSQFHQFVLNPMILAEISMSFKNIEDLIMALPSENFMHESIPLEAAFLAGKCFLNYRKRGGAKTSPLPDFFIGAHAAVSNYELITRDVSRYRTYFPSVSLIYPEN